MAGENPLIFDPGSTAVLSMDLHKFIVSQYARDAEGLMARVAAVQNHARARGMRVMHVRVGFRPGLPEISDRNTLYASIKSNPKWAQAFAGETGNLHPSGAPQGDEVVITKHRMSAFTGTDLEMILRANGIETLVLFGIATGGVVLATFLDGIDLDYRLIVIHDCCVDQNPEVHACLAEKFFTRYGRVVSVGEFLDAGTGESGK